MLKNRGVRAFVALLAMTAGAGTMHATNLLTATGPVAVTCSTVTGPGAAANITIKPVTALTLSNTLAVFFNAPGSGLVVTAPSITTLSTANQSVGITFTVAVVNGCVGATTGAVTVQFKAGGVADVSATVNDTVSATASGLLASNVTVSCTRTAGPVYTPGLAQTVSVTSSATGGTPFTVDTSGSAAWLTATPLTGGTATSTAVTFTVAAVSPCGSYASGSTNTTTIHLVNAPAPDKIVTVTLQVVPSSPLTATPSPASLSYVKGSGTAGYVDVTISSAASPAPFFALNTATLPIWLTVDSTTGTVPKHIRFSSTSVCDTLAPGTYTATVYVKVSGYADLPVPISLLITNKAPKLSVSEGTTRNISWTLGSPLPTPFITPLSTDSPIPYSITTGGTLAPVIAQLSGLAYSFGSPIGVTFNPLVFAAAQPGSTLTGTVTLTWGSPASTIVVTFNISIVSPGASMSGLTPASLPTAAAGQVFTVVLTGSGFVPSTDPTQKTKVGVVVSGTIVPDTNISANVVNASNIILTITVPAFADANLPFALSGTGGSVNLGICNPAGASCSIPSGTAILTIGSGPIIQAATSAAAYTQVTPPALPSMAPSDMISLFGANFCSSGGTGCGSSQILAGTPDPVTLRYPTSLSPDSAGPTQRAMTVTFQTHGASPSVLGTAPLLFATNGQINLLVPVAVAASIGSQVDMVVNFGYGSGATMKSSAPFPVNIVAANPGIFTVGADGQGDAAALNQAWSIISSSNFAGMRSTASDSDTLQFYVTGLGVPDSSADNSVAGSGSYTWSSDCVSNATFLSSLNAATSNSFTSLDGTVIQSALLGANRFPPCITTGSAVVPTVTVGGVAGTVIYAGAVADSVAGLYQINVTLPATTGGPFTSSTGAQVSSITAPVQLPVVFTTGGNSSQGGVNIWVTPKLKVDPPTGAALTGTVGVAWASSNNRVVATEGTSTYRYALTSGLLPSGLTLNSVTGAISGTPGANTAGNYVVTVTATDSANIPVTGSVSFTLTVAGGLIVTSSGTAPYSGTFGSANASLTTTSATGGTFPYSYAITSPGSLPTGMTINAASGVIGISALTPAGTYHVTVTATDSTAGTALTGTVTFDIVVGLQMARTTPVTGTHGAASTVSTVTATGQTGTVTYTLDAATLALSYVTINASTGVVAITNASVAGTVSAVVTATDGSVAPGAASAATGTIGVTITIN